MLASGARLTAVCLSVPLAGCALGGLRQLERARPSRSQSASVAVGSDRCVVVAAHRSVSLRITGRAVSDVTCLLSTRGPVRVHVASQASAQAYTEFDTSSLHQSQVYGPAAPGVHNAGRDPASGRSCAERSRRSGCRRRRELIATSGSPTRQGGAYVTITVGHVSGSAARTLAIDVGRAVFAAGPAQ